MTRQRRKHKHGQWLAIPLPRYLLITFGSTIALTVGMATLGSISVPVAWLVSINIVTFAAYGFDKAIASSESTWMRVPENVLLALVATGGTPGAIVGMPLFRHKTVKAAFRARFWIIVGVQIALLAAVVLTRV
ncbi:MAG: DUF1294 domain-containing protein [Chloroflexi bacterium]|nr:DUF1294 domain-containing protein [Chloroflexota bacterium]